MDADGSGRGKREEGLRNSSKRGCKGQGREGKG